LTGMVHVNANVTMSMRNTTHISVWMSSGRLTIAEPRAYAPAMPNVLAFTANVVAKVLSRSENQQFERYGGVFTKIHCANDEMTWSTR